MKRRDALTGLLAAAIPSTSRAQAKKTLRFVPKYGLTVLDPVFSIDLVTRMCGLAIYESLYATDRNLVAKPQMAAGHTVDQDGKRWTIVLRDGLRFHDGEPVLARDCVASIRRWMARDLLSKTLAARLDALQAPDDRTVVFRLNQPFAYLPFALGKPLSNMLPIMPARLAETSPDKPMTELIGSGAFRFLPGEFQAGQYAAFVPYDAYRSRDEAPDGTAGAHRVLIDRLEWLTIPDPSTAANALIAGEVDWLQSPLPDLLPLLDRNPAVTIGQFDQHGSIASLRLNHLQGPTANRAIRQAIMAAIDPVEVMQAVSGDNPNLFTASTGFFVPGVASQNDRGLERLGGRKSKAEIQAMLRDAGYAGEPLVVLHATDDPPAHAEIQVVVARLRGVGMVVDDVVMDSATSLQRMRSREPLDKGGWSISAINPDGSAHIDPLVALGLRTGPAALMGWPQDPRMEELRTAWIDSTDDAERRRIAGEIQDEGLKEVVYIPLGQFRRPSAWRRNVSGILPAVLPLFWNVQKG